MAGAYGYKAKGPVGTGQRFRRLERALGRRKGVKSPGAVAAFIGRKKYGKGRFQKMAAAGRMRSK